MQDKYTNKEAMNKGWNQMQQILDKEMPARSQGRRAIWLWLLPVLLMAGLGSGYAIYNYATTSITLSNSNNPEEEVKQPVSKEKRPPMAATFDRTDDENPDNKVNHSKTEGGESNDLVANNINAENNIDKNLLQANSFKAKRLVRDGSIARSESIQSFEEVKSNGIITNDHKEQLSVSDGAADVGSIADNDKIIESNTAVKKTTKMSSQMREMVSITVPPIDEVEPTEVIVSEDDERTDFQPLDYLPTPEVDLTVYNGLAAKGLPSILPVSTSRNKVSFAATSQFRFNNDIGLRGIGAGIELGYSLNPNLNLFAGLQYDYQREGNIAEAITLNNFRSSDALSSLNDLNLDNFRDGNYVASNISNEEIRILTQSLHYLHLPVGAEFALSNRFALRAGARLSYLMGAPSKVNVSFPENNLGTNSQFDNASKNNLFSEGFIQNTDIAASVGVSYYLNRRIAIDASYDHGFTPIYGSVESNGENDFNRLFTLGLRYTFSRL